MEIWYSLLHLSLSLFNNLILHYWDVYKRQAYLISAVTIVFALTSHLHVKLNQDVSVDTILFAYLKMVWNNNAVSGRGTVLTSDCLQCYEKVPYLTTYLSSLIKSCSFCKIIFSPKLGKVSWHCLYCLHIFIYIWSF